MSQPRHCFTVRGVPTSINGAALPGSGGAWAPYGLFLGFLVLALGLSLGNLAKAQTPPTKPAPVPATQASASKVVVAQSVSGPAWTELTPVERNILQPLAASWNGLSQGHKRKWLQMTKSYPTLSTEEQVKMQGRMKEWVALSPQQRTLARLNFAKTKELSKELTAEEKKAKWQAYQALSEEEKRKLAAKAPAKPVGAAATAKPVAPQKLASVPSRADKPKGKPAPKIADAQPGTGLGAAATPAAVPGATTPQTP
ncbi:DUF3106 domain-containing protein [Polaromonas sp. A23]|uniref:DUF3106 domain-containing protein n=1 Tax=Polaromonas sp. A23 TaxID=1944133 RepID=UPI000985C2EA|nr:DUF3106 domain-containing protein [Polaromonas sp. A23]